MLRGPQMPRIRRSFWGSGWVIARSTNAHYRILFTVCTGAGTMPDSGGAMFKLTMFCTLLVAIVMTAYTFSADPPAQGNAAAPVPDLGVGASLHGKRVFPERSPWNKD